MLLGRGRFVDDLGHPHAMYLAFVRSAQASGELRAIDATEATSLPGVRAVFTAADLGNPGFVAALELEQFVPTKMPLLAEDRIRFAGEPIAVVVADDPYVAEDAADLVLVEIEDREPVVSIDAALAGRGPVHDEAPNGVLIDLPMFEDALIQDALDHAHLVLERTFTSARVSAAPIEGRACLAEWDDRTEQLVVHMSTQVPHQVRSGIAEMMGLPERSVRVIAPDVGGGFGLKCVVGREEAVAALVARRLGRVVRWTEDRRENLTSSFHGHEQEYRVRIGFDSVGRILALDADVRCDVGAYSVYPFTCGVEPLMAITELPGVYKVGRYAARGRAIATNKPPTAPYRGVSRPQIVLVMERLMDTAAEQLGISAIELRHRNIIQAEDFPYTGPNGITYEPGSYQEALDLCAAQIEEAGWRAPGANGLLRGVGIACFSERTAYGTATMGLRKMAMTPGYDVVHIRMDPSGDVVVTTGTCGHGQGHETTFAQIVADQLGVHPDRVKLRQGDTDISSYGWGTFGSRSIVIGGGAASVAAGRLANQLRCVAAEMLETDMSDVELTGGHAQVRGTPDARLSMQQIAQTVHFRAHSLSGNHQYLLEARGEADPPGMFSNAVHAALVEVDPGTGGVRVVDYLVVEDCGVIINPMIVDGQVMGGVAQGIAAALYERILFTGDGQPQSGNFMDYLVPTASEIPRVRVHHLETRCELSETGAKGMGEGGTIGAPAAVLNAVNNALRSYGAQIDHIPVLPDDVVATILEHQ
jgi:aerobic carbon-monoxide dehydrogenase large subunit